MTRLYNDPADFAEEIVEGLVLANAGRLRRVRGGVARTAPTRDGGVAIVIGGGSGHYPAFGGLVGPGLAHGAAMGNLFASPSAQQVHGVATAVAGSGGVLLSYGNYAGDVLHFDAAQARLREEGIDCRTVVVTDDVASAPVDRRAERRGIAGDLVVFRIAGAAAEAGHDLDTVERLARHANDRTRSFGVAFAGCTLPGATGPLFTVPEGRMAVGLGIHGEPGIAETDVPSADGLAARFVETLLAERPADAQAGGRVVPILNGLGSVKYEELFVVYRGIARRLEAAGIRIVAPEVGEFCTSFDMAGASLTLLWLDDELESLWSAPVDTPAYRHGAQTAPVPTTPDRDDQHEVGAADGAAGDEPLPAATAASRRAARTVLDGLVAAGDAVNAAADELGRIDRVAGDGDHGIGMRRGVQAAVEAARRAVERGAGAGSVLRLSGDAWADRAGGASGALWGVALRAVGERIGDRDRPTARVVASAVADGLDAIRRIGGAEPGDKTMVDAIAPFAAALLDAAERDVHLSAAWIAAAPLASRAAAATADIPAKRGRAKTHGDASLGTPDAGATSFALVVTAFGDALAARTTNEDGARP